MILLPVIERELRVAARGRQTYRNRFLAALGMTGVLLWVLYGSRGIPQAALGDEIFQSITYTALCVSLLAGFFHTADSISEERREGTLGLLYLTDLRSLHIVLGKIFANSIPAFFALATIVPILGIPFLLGGISPGELERSSLVLLAALWLSLAAGVLASSMVKDDRAALLITFGLIFMPTAIAPALHHAAFSSFWSLGIARDKVFGALGRHVFWMSLAQQFILACLYVLLAAWQARLTWREKPSGPLGEKTRRTWRAWSSGAPAQRKAWREAMLDENPALWLTCRRRERTALLWAIIGIGAVWFTWIWFAEHRIEGAVGMMGSVCFHWILKITVAFAAGRALADEARNGSFELLFTTHLTPARLLQGHLWGLTRSFGIATIVVVIADALWIGYGRLGTIFSSTFPTFLWMRLLILLCDLATIAIYGMWLGFKFQRSGKAALRILLYVVVLPNLGWVFLLSGRDPLGAIVVIWLVIDAFLIGLGLQNLKALRERAAERFVASSVRG
jgi:ABC-type transport system involved in cytochrome c biogenesis permease component